MRSNTSNKVNLAGYNTNKTSITCGSGFILPTRRLLTIYVMRAESRRLFINGENDGLFPPDGERRQFQTAAEVVSPILFIQQPPLAQLGQQTVQQQILLVRLPQSVQ